MRHSKHGKVRLHGTVLEETGLISFYRVGLCALESCAAIQCHAKKSLMEFNSCSETTDLGEFKKENIKYFNSRWDHTKAMQRYKHPATVWKPNFSIKYFSCRVSPHLKHISSPIKLKHKFKITWTHVTILEKKLQFKSSFSRYHVFIKLTTVSL